MNDINKCFVIIINNGMFRNVFETSEFSDIVFWLPLWVYCRRVGLFFFLPRMDIPTFGRISDPSGRILKIFEYEYLQIVQY